MLTSDHYVIPVWDPRASLAFYREVLGLPLVQTITGDDWGGRPWLMMVFGLADGRELVLVALRGAARPAAGDLPADTRHYALAATGPEEQDEFRARLQAAGVDVWEEDHGPQHSLYFADPNGVIIEITTPPTTLGDPDPTALARAEDWIAQRPESANGRPGQDPGEA